MVQQNTQASVMSTPPCYRSRCHDCQGLLSQIRPGLHHLCQATLYHLPKHHLEVLDTQSTSTHTVRTNNGKSKCQHAQGSRPADLPDAFACICNVPVLVCGESASSPVVDLRVSMHVSLVYFGEIAANTYG
jgi:hypothetical protein